MEQLHRTSLTLAALAIVLAIAYPASALANSAQTQWEGTTSTGAIVADENCPIVVDSESLVFDVDVFPQEYYGEDDDLMSYDARVTATYEFRNPADYSVRAKLAFPFGTLPDYIAQEVYYAEDGKREPVSSNGYGVAINGKPAQTTLRHTLSYPFDDFRLERDVALLVDEYVNDPFYAPDLPVTKFTYDVSGIPEDNHAATVGFLWTPSPESKIMLIDQSGLQRPDPSKSESIVNTWAENGRPVTVYVLGKAPDKLDALLFEDGGCEERLDGQVTCISSETMSFEAFALQEWDEGSPVLRHDWYNAMVEHLNRCDVGKDGAIMTTYFSSLTVLDLSLSLMRWYEYEIALEPGETIANAVTAPVYPSINAKYKPSIYGYSYLLSPASLWADFDDLQICVKTPFHMLESNLGDFERLESGEGYKLAFNGLPNGELEFTLSESESPKAPSFASQYSILLPMLAMAAVPLLVIGLLIGVFLGLKRRR